MSVVVGVDGGGTRTRVVLAAVDGGELGEVLGRGEGSPALVDSRDPGASALVIARTVRRAAAEGGVELPATALVAGLAGAGRPDERRAVAGALEASRIAGRVRVTSDAVAAFHHAFGDGPGILLVAGTGSMALGRGPDGTELRVGGWGAFLGDEGSAYDIARRALRASARAADGRGDATDLRDRVLATLGLSDPQELVGWAARASKAEVAGLAPEVFGAAGEGDADAGALVDAAGAALLRHVEVLRERLGPWPGEPGVALAGGVARPGGSLHGRLAEGAAELGCRVRSGEVDAALGAARLAAADLRADAGR